MSRSRDWGGARSPGRIHLEMQKAMLEISALSKRFDGEPALESIDLSVGAGEIVAILGTSGSGKSTLLRVVGGIEPPSGGEVRLDGKIVTGPSPKLGFVFQEPRLMPWLRVRDNVAFGLGALPRAEQRALADAALDRVGLTDAADFWPRQLSGGMAQRVAIARALVTRPAGCCSTNRSAHSTRSRGSHCSSICSTSGASMGRRCCSSRTISMRR